MKQISSPAVWACLMAVLLLSGCSQKKPAVAVPQTPAAAQQPPAPQPTPAETQQQTQSQASPTQGTPPPEPQPSPPGEPGQPEQPAVEKTESAKAKTAKPRANAKKPGTEAARNAPKTVVKAEAEQPPTAGQISPSLPNAEIARDQATTEQLLQGTESTLNGITRQLSEDEKAIATQIRDYVKQSRQATQANDLPRAYNLAIKARLLADDLAKRR